MKIENVGNYWLATVKVANKTVILCEGGTRAEAKKGAIEMFISYQSRRV